MPIAAPLGVDYREGQITPRALDFTSSDNSKWCGFIGSGFCLSSTYYQNLYVIGIPEQYYGSGVHSDNGWGLRNTSKLRLAFLAQLLPAHAHQLFFIFMLWRLWNT